MSAAQDPEVVVDLVIDQIRGNIEAALVDIRKDRADPRIQTPKPVAYYVSEKFDPLQLPAVYVIADTNDFQKDKSNANFNAGKMVLYVNCVVDGIDTDILTRRCYRYMGAFRKVLDQVELTSSNQLIKITLVAEKVMFSPVYSKAQKQGKPDGAFAKEFSMTISAYYSENF